MIRLGSNSPTRAKILEAFNIEFIQNGGNFDEDSIKTTNPKEFCYLATKGKFDELYSKFGVEDFPLLSICCNTYIYFINKKIRF